MIYYFMVLIILKHQTKLVAFISYFSIIYASKNVFNIWCFFFCEIAYAFIMCNRKITFNQNLQNYISQKQSTLAAKREPKVNRIIISKSTLVAKREPKVNRIIISMTRTLKVMMKQIYP